MTRNRQPGPGRIGLLEKRGGYMPTEEWPDDVPIEDLFEPVSDGPSESSDNDPSDD